MKVKKSYKEVREINFSISNYLVSNGYWDVEKGKFSKKDETKLVAYMKKVKKECELICGPDDYGDKKDDLQIKHCLKDEKTKAILMADTCGADGKTYTRVRQYSEEGELALKKALKELDATEVELNVKIADGDWDLTEEEKEIFSGILIPEIKKESSELESAGL